MLDVNNFDSMRIGVASPQQIRSWSYGEVKKPETINYRTLKPERDGLFCEKIFGPTKDWECHCGKYKRIRYKGIVCDRCGVEVTRSKVRRDRMGHIELATPVSHIWYFKGIPSRMGLILDISPRSLERVLYFAYYIVTDTGETSLVKKQLLSETEYHEAVDKYGASAFKVGMGAEAIKQLLSEIDLPKMSAELRAELKETSGQRKIRAVRRLEVCEAFRKSGNRPEWMVLDIVPVIPPELRPMVQLDGGRFATSDLNDLYRRVINRNNRLKRLLELSAPDIIVRNEKRMLQEAVDALIDNGRRGRPVTGPGNRPLKSLSDMLKGKQGRFRQNLLGKRVDYSGRSVIVVGPELKMHQCGLPKEMALELFKPFVMKKLVHGGQAQNIKNAKRKVERATAEVWDVLEEVIKEHPVLLNRAPTLHRLGIQAFEPILSEGRAIKIHPLVCTAYNADFDGDQMAVHVPLSVEAQAEARMLMLSSHNILAPKDGKPVAVPTQDMILGSYYLTIIREGAKGTGHRYSSYNEAMLAYHHGEVSLQARIKVRMPNADIFLEEKNEGYSLVETTIGNAIFNEALPIELRYFYKKDGVWHLEELLGKKALGILVAASYKLFGHSRTAVLLDEIKKMSFAHACHAGITIAVSDIIVPERKGEILAAADLEVEKTERQFRRGLLSEEERYRKVIKLWDDVTDEVTNELMHGTLDPFNPVYMMANSGARGNIKQIRQLAGMRGLMADPSGRIIDLPIKANFREGLTVLEYFISTHGARKGLADTALRTADSGYLTRRLVDVAQDVIVREEDCDIVSISIFKEYNRLRKKLVGCSLGKLEETLIGRNIAAEVVSPITGEVLVPKDTYLDKATFDLINQHRVLYFTLYELDAQYAEDVESVKLNISDEEIRTVLKEKMMYSLVGHPLAEDVVNTDDEVIYQTNTILTEEMIDHILTISRTIKSVRIRMNQIVGIEVATIRDAKGKNIIESLQDRLIGRTLAENIIDEETGEILYYTNDLISEDIADEIAKIRETVTIRSVLNCKCRVGVCRKCYGRNLATGQLVDIGEAVGIIAAQSIGEPGTQLTMRTFHTGGVAGDDITQGLPRVEELFEARKPKRPAVLSEHSGRVSIQETKGVRKATIYVDGGEEHIYPIPYGAKIHVDDGMMVEIGERLTEGALNPHDVLRISGAIATQRYIVHEVQHVYKSQGVEINDKHIEVMVRQMMRKVKIEEAGDTAMLPGEYIDWYQFNLENKKTVESGGEPAEGRMVLLGITKASLATDSFLSAASFQETTRVLTDAAIKGKVDPLVGLKENVIIGKLVPAGTGMNRYRDIDVVIN